MWHSTEERSRVAALKNFVLDRVGFGRRQLHSGTFESSALRPILLGTLSGQQLRGGTDDNDNDNSGGNGIASGLVGAVGQNMERLLAGLEGVPSVSEPAPLVPDAALRWARQVLPGGEPDATRTAEVRVWAYICEAGAGFAVLNPGVCDVYCFQRVSGKAWMAASIALPWPEGSCHSSCPLRQTSFCLKQNAARTNLVWPIYTPTTPNKTLLVLETNGARRHAGRQEQRWAPR
jgi:hypothetical protein